MPTKDPLDPILAETGTTSTPLGRSDVERLARRLGTASPDEFIDAVVHADGLGWDDGRPRPKGSFEVHNRNWWIDVTDSGNRAHLLAVIVAAALADALRLEPGVLWIARAVPGVVSVAAAGYDSSGLRLLLRRHPAPALPPHLARTVHPGDFAEFVKAVAAAPDAVPLPAGGTVTFVSS